MCKTTPNRALVAYRTISDTAGYLAQNSIPMIRNRLILNGSMGHTSAKKYSTVPFSSLLQFWNGRYIYEKSGLRETQVQHGSKRLATCQNS